MSVERKVNFYTQVENDPVRTVSNFYTRFYIRDKEDSPDKSRLNLIRRAKSLIETFGEGEHVLDIGAGRQILEREYTRMFGKVRCQMESLDIADLKRKQLLARKGGISHLRASGTELPCGDDSYALVISGMALDFMPEAAIGEVYRIMKPGARALVNLHHRDLIPKDLDELLKRPHLSRRRRSVLEFWKYLRDGDVLAKDPDDICSRFKPNHFLIESIRLNSDCFDKWWEVDLAKPF